MSTTRQQDDSSLADRVASLAISTYDALPARSKPVIRSNGVKEWTILASIVLVFPKASIGSCASSGTEVPHEVTDDSPVSLRVISQGTGVKCLPYNRLPPVGDTLHDQHAEVLARRGFRRWMVDEAIALNTGTRNESDSLLCVSQSGKYRLKDIVRVWMYISTLPCGDASTTYTAAYQPIEMAQLKSRPALNPSITIPSRHATESSEAGVNYGDLTDPSSSSSSGPSLMRGRNGYTLPTTLRTKPGRPDSFPSISHSCSDKMTVWNVLGLQGALLSDAFEPVYIDDVVIGEVDPPTATQSQDGGSGLVGWAPDAEQRERGLGFRDVVGREVEMALFGRVDGIEDKLPAPYRIAHPKIHFTDIPFPYSRSTTSTSPPLPISSTPAFTPSSSSVDITQPLSTPTPKEPAPMINCILHLPHSRTVEELYQGCDRRQLWKAPGLVPLPEKRRSVVCKLEMMKAMERVRELGDKLGEVRSGHSGVMDTGCAEDKDERNSTAATTATSIGHEFCTITYRQLKHPLNPSYQTSKTILRGVPALTEVIIPGFERCGALRTTVAQASAGDKATVLSIPGTAVAMNEEGNNGMPSSHSSPPSTPSPPFVGWLVSDPKWEQFDSSGVIRYASR